MADYLRAIGDKYNEQILAAYEQLRKAPCNNRFEQFKRIAHRIIENGINWGRISVILMLGTMLLKFQGQHLAESLLKFLLDFISKRLFSWIVDSGGWVRKFLVNESIRIYCYIPFVDNKSHLENICVCYSFYCHQKDRNFF